ncbi:MAG: hypothetical protein ABFS86_00925 [Planctomycetota bacterium]
MEAVLEHVSASSASAVVVDGKPLEDPLQGTMEGSVWTQEEKVGVVSHEGETEDLQLLRADLKSQEREQEANIFAEREDR